MKYPKYFSLKMNREKSIFHFEKHNLEHIGNSLYTTECLAFLVLLARLYLKVKVYITQLLSVYIIYKKSHALNEVILLGFLPFWGFLWPWKLTLIGHWMNFNSPILFPWWLKAMFFTRCLYFHHNWWKERGTKINSLIFLKDVTEEKNAEIHKHAEII